MAIDNNYTDNIILLKDVNELCVVGNFISKIKIYYLHTPLHTCLFFFRYAAKVIVFIRI